MNRIARSATLLVALLLAATATGCSAAEQESEKASPSDVAPLYLEAMRGNVSGLKEYNPDTELTEEGVFGSANSTFLETLGVSRDRRAGSPTHRGHAGRSFQGGVHRHR